MTTKKSDLISAEEACWDFIHDNPELIDGLRAKAERDVKSYEGDPDDLFQEFIIWIGARPEIQSLENWKILFKVSSVTQKQRNRELRRRHDEYSEIETEGPVHW